VEGWNFPTVPASALNINSASRPKEFGVTGYGVERFRTLRSHDLKIDADDPRSLAETPSLKVADVGFAQSSGPARTAAGATIQDEIAEYLDLRDDLEYEVGRQREPYLAPTLQKLAHEREDDVRGNPVVDYRMVNPSEWLGWKKKVVRREEQFTTAGALVAAQIAATRQAIAKGYLDEHGEEKQVRVYEGNYGYPEFAVDEMPDTAMPEADLPGIPEHARKYPVRNLVSFVDNGDLLEIVHAETNGERVRDVAFVFELEKFDGNGFPAFDNVETSQTQTLIRTDIISQLEHVQKQFDLMEQVHGRTSMKSALNVEHIPTDLILEDCSIFRGRADVGYPFLSDVAHAMAVVVSPVVRPMVGRRPMQVYDVTKVATFNDGYQDPGLHILVQQQFHLVLGSCYSRGVKKIVMRLPGSTRECGHPPTGSAFAIREPLWKYGHLFDEIIILVPSKCMNDVYEIIFPTPASLVRGPVGNTYAKGEGAAEEDIYGENKAREVKNVLSSASELALAARGAAIEIAAEPHFNDAAEERRLELAKGTLISSVRGRRNAIYLDEDDAERFSSVYVTGNKPPTRGDEFGLSMMHVEPWSEDCVASTAIPGSPSKRTFEDGLIRATPSPVSTRAPTPLITSRAATPMMRGETPEPSLVPLVQRGEKKTFVPPPEPQEKKTVRRSSVRPRVSVERLPEETWEGHPLSPTSPLTTVFASTLRRPVADPDFKRPRGPVQVVREREDPDSQRKSRSLFSGSGRNWKA
jgi:hypothetical protein